MEIVQSRLGGLRELHFPLLGGFRSHNSSHIMSNHTRFFRVKMPLFPEDLLRLPELFRDLKPSWRSRFPLEPF